MENAGNFHCNCPEGFEGRQCEQSKWLKCYHFIQKFLNKKKNDHTDMNYVVLYELDFSIKTCRLQVTPANEPFVSYFSVQF